MKKDLVSRHSAIYHICNKSIANYLIFRHEKNIIRFLHVLEFYNQKTLGSFSRMKKSGSFQSYGLLLQPHPEIVQFLAYCIMPDHYHLLVQVLNIDLFVHYMNLVEISYSRYFNLFMGRKGPLWQSRFRQVTIDSDDLFLHVSRYIHLNPSTSNIVEDLDEWEWSSYHQLTHEPELLSKLKYYSISNPIKYAHFVKNNIQYQRKMRQIKKLLPY